MEDGSDGLPSDPPLPEPMKNGEVMARLQEEGSNDKDSALVKVNGGAILEETKSEESDSSDYDALVIDESATSKSELRKPKAAKAGFKGFKNTTDEELDSYMHSNPYFAESIFELFEKSQEKKGGSEAKKTVGCNRHQHVANRHIIGEGKKGKANPKLREYAQYLGLQPTVQFKCSKCSRAGFQSLASLNYHILRCDDTAPANGVSGAPPSGPPSTNFRVTRKVFLCSACGTYYENWNLFLHMREVHKRYICLYCLGMFSHPEKLSLHIVSKHNCVPSRINTLEEFYDAHKEPCFLMCCECQKGFTESDNFFQHQCVEAVPKTPLLKTAVAVKQNNSKNQKNVEHVTADSDKTESGPPSGRQPDNQRSQDPQVKHETPKSTTDDHEGADTAEDCHLTQEGAPPPETMETKQQENITCNSNLTQVDSQQPAPFDDAERMQKDGAVSFCGSDEDSFGISPEPAEKPSDDEDDCVEEEPAEKEEEAGETRKVPKVTLKFKDFEYRRPDESEVLRGEEEENCESDDSEKLTMEVDRIEDESREDSRGAAREPEEGPVVESEPAAESQTMQVAGTDVPIVELELEQPLDRFEAKRLLQKCLRTTIATCVYCNHARRISVNGKQLGLHAIAEHRFSAVVNSITAEELIPESFVSRIKDGLPELEDVYFNLEGGDAEETSITFSHVFECFQCRYSTAVHKELYLHNRKMHAKSILLCIMCKSNFYSYSELICHLCPGLYELERDVRFRCCLCVGDDLPSAFRLMVHLRKRHNACDVCLEPCYNQSKLSNHVWKHKLHHLCYRCGIAYRNKPDITKHLFWKHGTESVLCKKCLQKKWPHVYHFCILPPSFVCEECNLSFTKAVYLMVHKRLHSDIRPHVCSEEACVERFVSKKLLLKHEFKHREPIEEHHVETEKPPEAEPPAEVAENSSVHENAEDTESEQSGEKPKAKVDVYDLPELNLSESDSSESGDEAPKSAERCVNDCAEGEGKPEKPVLETIWDDFRNYRANQEIENPPVNLEAIMGDHDYCVVLEKPEIKEGGDPQPDHDYCFGPKGEANVVKVLAPAKSSSDSSSDSDSSSCTCGSNCSCSSSSGNNSSSSDSSSSDSSSSEGRRRQQERRERRRQKVKAKKKGADENDPVDVVTNDGGRAQLPAIPAVPAPEVPIQESDLETTESDTDEDFYDEQPQKLADKLLAEKKNQLLQVAAIGPYINGSIMDGSRPPTPSLPPSTGGSVKKKKSKSKKRKKKSKRDGKYESLTLSLPKHGNSPARDFPGATGTNQTAAEMDSSLRASKRRRVPNKFYGYSSDEERERVQPPAFKWRKVDLPAPPRSPLVVPPLTIKTKPSDPATSEPFHHQARQFRPPPPPPLPPPLARTRESATDSNESSSEDERTAAGPPRPPVPPVSTQPQPALYCYCRCPYDEVSEMIGCDSSDCAIEWFHFECVGIMVPPKGQWFCPDCRKKKQQRREMLHGHAV